MTTISVKFRPCTGKNKCVPGMETDRHDKDGTVCYQIIHGRHTRQIVSEYCLTVSEWKALRSDSVSDKHLRCVKNGINLDIDRLRRIVAFLQRQPTGFRADDIADEFRRIDRELRMELFVGTLSSRLRKQGCVRTAETYEAATASFTSFWHSSISSNCPRLDCLTVDAVEEYNEWLRSRGVANNTVSFYNRVLRAIYNKALDAEETMEDKRPFRRAYTGVGDTVKRAISLEAVGRIAIMDLSAFPSLDFARDMFLLSFCLRGMSFIDMAFLRKRDLRNGRLTYQRRKTGQSLEIQWTSRMQRILDKYPPNDTGFLLPIIRHGEADERRAYRNCAYNINRSLKKIGRMADIPIPLTLYAARHSWASAALAKGIPVSIISQGMGHDSERTTRIYLAHFDSSGVDRANALILDSLR